MTEQSVLRGDNMKPEKKQHIMNTAAKLFIENGFQSTPTSKIAKESGVSVGTLFNAFESKEDIINSTYIYIKTSIKEYVTENFRVTDSAEDNMRQIWKLMITYNLEHPTEFTYMEQYAHSPFVKKLTKEELKAYLGGFENILKICVLDKNRHEKYHDFTKVIMTNLFKATTNYLMDNDVDREDFLNYSFELFYNKIF